MHPEWCLDWTQDLLLDLVCQLCQDSQEWLCHSKVQFHNLVLPDLLGKPEYSPMCFAWAELSGKIFLRGGPAGPSLWESQAQEYLETSNECRGIKQFAL